MIFTRSMIGREARRQKASLFSPRSGAPLDSHARSLSLWRVHRLIIIHSRCVPYARKRVEEKGSRTRLRTVCFVVAKTAERAGRADGKAV